jgi:hypothetical protein
MKLAITKNGQVVTAAENAPLEAQCPLCNHPVVLRKRRLMNGRGFVYYWRHKPGGNLNCAARSSYRGFG